MSEPARMAKFSSFINNKSRAHIYEVLAAYAQAGLSMQAATENLHAAYRDKKPDEAREIAGLKAKGGQDIGAALLETFRASVPEEIALLKGLSAKLSGEGSEALEEQERLRCIAIMLGLAARIAAVS